MNANEAIEKQAAALKKVREDINWMLNSRQLLNAHVFDYLDDVLAATATIDPPGEAVGVPPKETWQSKIEAAIPILGRKWAGQVGVDSDIALWERLTPAIRQLRHNDGSQGFVFAYDMAIVDREFAALEGACHARLCNVWDDALEEAALICDQQAKEPECHERAEYCADEIRALKKAIATAPRLGDATTFGGAK